MYTPVNVTAAWICEVMSCSHILEWGLGWSMEIRNGGTMWTDYAVNVYCQKLQGKWNKNMPHALNGVCTIYALKMCVWR